MKCTVCWLTNRRLGDPVAWEWWTNGQKYSMHIQLSTCTQQHHRITSYRTCRTCCQLMGLPCLVTFGYIKATHARLLLYVRSIRRGAYAPLSKSISPVARDLVKRLLCVDPAARITWDQLSSHPWLATQVAQQQDKTTSSSGAPCCCRDCSSSQKCGDSVCSSVNGEAGWDGGGSAPGHSISRHADELRFWDSRSCPKKQKLY
jgi:serine/threonine protein kinase